jgi:hypothetical protein
MRVECPQWTDIGAKTCGRCALGKFGGRPSLGMCARCLNPQETPSVGLGDTIAKLTAAGKKRQAALNRMVPYRGDSAD